MKNILLLGLSLLLAAACGTGNSQQNNQNAQQDPPAATENAAVEPVAETPKAEATPAAKVQNSMLLGEIEKQDFLSPPFDSWFNANYDSYTPGHEELAKIQSNLSDVDSIRVYMGTWCPDSRREVPQFFKILDAAEYDLDKVEMVAVDRSKKAPDGSHELYQVSMVPTFIFYKNGEEIGRYVEHPRESIEKDIAKIVSGEAYKHSYDY